MFRGGMAALAVFGLLAFLGPWRRPVLAGARGVLGGERFDQVDGSTVRVASFPTPEGSLPRSFPQQVPDNLTDGFANTTWATRWLGVEDAGTVVAPSDRACVVGARTDTEIRFTFLESTDLAKVAILGGRHAEDGSAGLFSRPLLLEFEVRGECEHIELASEGELEIHDFSHGDVGVVVMRVVDIFPDPEQPTTVEIAEVIFAEK
jgi:hypothetical protein